VQVLKDHLSSIHECHGTDVEIKEDTSDDGSYKSIVEETATISQEESKSSNLNGGWPLGMAHKDKRFYF
jgi:hypothetical protein